jgi:hypothetical protein
VTRARGLAAFVVAGALLLAGCASEPRLLDEDAYGEVTESAHNDDLSLVPAGGFCTALRAFTFTTEQLGGSQLVLADPPGTLVGAQVVQEAPGLPLDDVLELAIANAELCAEEAEASEYDVAIEPLEGLDTGDLGWRTRDADGMWGEIVLSRLDDDRLVAVGFQTYGEDAPVDVLDLLETARESADQFPATSDEG